jgi:RNA polymerase-associated protein LEO1
VEDEEEYYRGYVNNMIRWRYKYSPDDDTQISRDGDGNPLRESNTRLVKWSDGTYTLHVGQELLEVDNLDSSVPVDADGGGTSLPGFAGINGYLYVSQKARVRPPSKKDMIDPDDNNHETKHESSEEDEEETPAQPAGTVLECIGPITSRFAPRPASLASEAHRNLTLAMRHRNVKRARIAEFVTDFDPEKEKQARIKGKDDLAKSQNRGARRSGGGGGRRRGMNPSYLEEDEDYEGVNLGRLKRQTMRREYGNEDEEEVMDYGEDSDEEEDEWSKNKKRKRGAALQAARASSAKEKVNKKKAGVGNFDEDDESSEEGEVVFGEDDDEEEEGAMFKKRTGGGAKKSDFLDDDDDE